MSAACPAWCTQGSEEFQCRGEHFDDKVFVPATGGTHPREVSSEGGAVFPVVGVGLDYSVLDGAQGPSICVWITGTDQQNDAEAYLKPREVAELVKELQARLALLPGIDEPTG